MNIPVIFNKKHFLHDPGYEIYEGKRITSPEKPKRMDSIIFGLKGEGITEFYEPADFGMEFIEKVHNADYLDFINNISRRARSRGSIFPSYYILDTYTPVQKNTFSVSKRAADVALTGAEMLLNEKVVYSMCRPPGHHAEKNRMGGYCYFNNAAVAGEFLSSYGKVAILDIDFHHGNGTQNIFYDRSDVLFVSIHADPRQKYPYYSGFENETGVEKGKGFNVNFPLPLGAGEIVYKKNLVKALGKIKEHKSKYLIVSLGFDTYLKDPIGGFNLKIPFFKNIAKEIASLKIPVLLVQEGGYNIEDLGKLAVSFLSGF